MLYELLFKISTTSPAVAGNAVDGQYVTDNWRECSVTETEIQVSVGRLI